MAFQFEKLEVYQKALYWIARGSGVQSITLYYQSINNLMAAEVMELSPDGHAVKVTAHYTTD